jgi:RNA polymerase sigma-70 factor (ECF subfamily)
VERSKITTYRLAYDLTGNRHDAEDLSQDAYIRAFRGLPGFRGESKWSSWLHRITLNTFLDQRRSNRDKTVEYDDDIEPTEAMRTTLNHMVTPGPDRRADNAVIQEHIERALSCLSPTERSVFVMRHYHDLPLREIGAALSLADGTVKVHLFRAVRRLQKQLEYFMADLGPEGR